MRTLEDLTKEESNWKIAADWISKAKNKIEVLPRNQKQAEENLVQMQLTTHSILGAVVYETGGLLVDNGWIRILGSGSDKMTRTLASWNKGKTFGEYGEPAPYLFVADDAIGGLYAINGGYLGKDEGKIYYFSPEYLEWISLDVSYPEFLLFSFDGNMEEFYEAVRWKDWKDDLQRLDGDHAYTFSPFLWSRGNTDINEMQRKVFKMEEVYNFNLDMKEEWDLRNNL